MSELQLLTRLLMIRSRALLTGDADVLWIMDPMIMQVAWHYDRFRERSVRAVWEDVLSQINDDPMALQTPCAFLDAISPPRHQLLIEMAPLDERGPRVERRRPQVPALTPDPEVTQLIEQLDEFDCPQTSRYPVVLAAGAISSAWPSLLSVLEEGLPRPDRRPPPRENMYLERARQVFRTPVRRVAETSFGGHTVFAGYSIFGELDVHGGTAERGGVSIERRNDGLVEAQLWDEQRRGAGRMLIDQRLGFFRGTILDLRGDSGSELATAFINRTLGETSFQIGPVER